MPKNKGSEYALESLPNIGPGIAARLRAMGIASASARQVLVLADLS